MRHKKTLLLLMLVWAAAAFGAQNHHVTVSDDGSGGITCDHHGDPHGNKCDIEVQNNSGDSITWDLATDGTDFLYFKNSPCVKPIAMNGNSLTCTVANSPSGGSACGADKRCFKYSFWVADSDHNVKGYADPEVIIDNSSKNGRGRPASAGDKSLRHKRPQERNPVK
jgi:hypothetical protein